jgi:hypothetical protein
MQSTSFQEYALDSNVCSTAAPASLPARITTWHADSDTVDGGDGGIGLLGYKMTVALGR